MSAHSVAAPSSLHMTLQCPGSIRMQSAYPEDGDQTAAAEGTAAHWVMAELMAERAVAVGARADNGVIVTNEMIDAAEVLVDDVLATVTPHGLGLSDCITEVAVSIPRVHAQCWGTPDVRVWLPGYQLVVWDLKYGHRHVPVFENSQLIAYAAGCIDAAGLSDLLVEVTQRIVQPRSYGSDGPVRSWTYLAQDVRAHVNLMNMAVAQALGSNPTTRVGPACRDCRAAHACTTLQRAGEAAMDLAGTAMPHDLPPDALGVELRYIERSHKLLTARKEALEEQALSMMRAGARVPGWSVKHSSGRVDWSKPAAEVIALGKLLGIDIARAPDPVTPLQAKAKGFPDALAATFTERKSGAAKLTADDGSEARRIFS